VAELVIPKIMDTNTGPSQLGKQLEREGGAEGEGEEEGGG